MEMRPLNIFQRCMRIWEESHPYNAAQIMRVAGDADLARIRKAWNETLVASGLGVARVVGPRFCYQSAPDQEVEAVDAGLGLDGFITRELNRPFGNSSQSGRTGTCITMPFRPFAVPGNGSHYLGVIYQHWVADSVAMRMVLREWFCRLLDPRRVSGRPLHVPHGGFWRYFGPGRAGWNLMEGAASVLEGMSQFSTARRIERIDGAQDVKCSLHHLPEGTVDALVEAARRRRRAGTTLNDLILAALARACDQHGAAPRRSSRDLALGTIVDLRATSRENLDETFGMFLGFTALVVPSAHLRDRDRLLATIASQNSHHKERRAAQVSMLRMAAGYVQGKFLSPERLADFYRDYMPLSGGVSNVNMNRSWAAQYHPSPLLDYIRVAPTGPMVPVVIAVTTIGHHFTFVLTRRVSLVDDQHAARLARAFADELTAQAKTG